MTATPDRQPSAVELARARNANPSTPAQYAQELRNAQMARRAAQREMRKQLIADGLVPEPVLIDRRRTAKPKPGTAPGAGKTRRTNAPRKRTP